MESTKGAGPIPDSKISATILDFGEPLLACFDELPPVEVLQSLLKIVITVWNAHVLALPIWGSPEGLEQLRTIMCRPDADPLTRAAYEDLSRRRRELFGDDSRAVGEWAIVPRDGGLVLRCDARLPHAADVGPSPRPDRTPSGTSPQGPETARPSRAAPRRRSRPR